ncbi:hypothetical protein [uncultured Alistipes sp.]|uniref:hypothetical protein n=1 Tax=uncultured Alistipes sp. TaxID=538949 RepID=UPI0025879EA0|nr:hypothetical protein [uncultured Alistipes sp.]
MTPATIIRARAFRDAYAELLRAWRADAPLTLDDATEICVKSYKAEYDFLATMLCEEMAEPAQGNPCALFDRVEAFLCIPEIFDGESAAAIKYDDRHYTGESRAARIQLFDALIMGRRWVDWDNPSAPCVTVGSVANALSELRKWVPAVQKERQGAAIDNNAQTDEQTDEGKRDIPRAQSIALLYAVFVRLGITQTHTDMAVARLIEAVTGGKIRDGKNSYAWKHRNDKLQTDVEELLNEFVKQ